MRPQTYAVLGKRKISTLYGRIFLTLVMIQQKLHIFRTLQCRTECARLYLLNEFSPYIGDRSAVTPHSIDIAADLGSVIAYFDLHVIIPFVKV